MSPVEERRRKVARVLNDVWDFLETRHPEGMPHGVYPLHVTIFFREPERRVAEPLSVVNRDLRWLREKGYVAHYREGGRRKVAEYKPTPAGRVWARAS